jgi:hypothetical protein
LNIDAIRPIITTGKKSDTLSREKAVPVANELMLTVEENNKRFNPLNISDFDFPFGGISLIDHPPSNSAGRGRQSNGRSPRPIPLQLNP